MLLDVAANGVLKIGDRVEDAAPDAPAGDDGEDPLDGVEPGGRGGREMEDPARMIGLPFPDLGMLVSDVVVGDGMNQLSRRYGPLNGIEKLDEFLVGVLGHAAANRIWRRRWWSWCRTCPESNNNRTCGPPPMADIRPITVPSRIFRAVNNVVVPLRL